MKDLNRVAHDNNGDGIMINLIIIRGNVPLVVIFLFATPFPFKRAQMAQRRT